MSAESRPQINRRDALRGFGAASLAALLDLTPSQVERAFANMASLAESREPTAEGPPTTQGQPYVPKFFSRSEWQTVRVLVDYVIPRDERSGSATDAKVPEFMDFLLADKDASLASQTSMRGGLGWLNRESLDRFDKSFVAATDAQRRQILDDIAWPAKARPEHSQGVAFFTRMRDFTASGFFSSQMGWRDLQYIGNVSNASWDGCPAPAMEKLGVSQDLMRTRPRSQ